MENETLLTQLLGPGNYSHPRPGKEFPDTGAESPGEFCDRPERGVLHPPLNVAQENDAYPASRRQFLLGEVLALALGPHDLPEQLLRGGLFGWHTAPC